MSKKRKEITDITFNWVATDGGFVFSLLVLPLEEKGTCTEFKVTSYENRIMEIAVDFKVSIQQVAKIVACMFSKKEHFVSLDLVILNYRNIQLRIKKNTGRKNIISMIMKEMSRPEYKKVDNKVSVNTKMCRKQNPLRESDKSTMCEFFPNRFFFHAMESGLLYENYHTGAYVLVSALKEGKVTVESKAKTKVCDFVEGIQRIFNPYSNFYGIKTVELEFNNFAITVDEQNVGRLMYLYNKSCAM